VHYAVSANSVDAVEALVGAWAGAVNVQDTERGETPLMQAIRTKKTEIAKFLAPLIDLQLQNTNGWSALMIAAATKNLAVVDMLLEVCTGLAEMVDLQDKERRTALMLAAANRSTNIMETLKDTGGACQDLQNLRGQMANEILVEARRAHHAQHRRDDSSGAAASDYSSPDDRPVFEQDAAQHQDASPPAIFEEAPFVQRENASQSTLDEQSREEAPPAARPSAIDEEQAPAAPRQNAPHSPLDEEHAPAAPRQDACLPALDEEEAPASARQDARLSALDEEQAPAALRQSARLSALDEEAASSADKHLDDRPSAQQTNNSNGHSPPAERVRR